MYYINYSFMIVSVFILCVTLFWHIWNQRNPHKPFTSFSFRWRSQVFGCMFWHRLFFYFFSRIFSFSFRSFSCRVFVSQIHTLRSVFAFSLAEAFPFWQTASNSGWTETNMIALQQISVVWKLFEGNLDSKALAGICLLRRKIKNRQKIYFDSFHSNQKKKDVEKEKNVRALVRFTRIWCKITSMEQRMKVTLWNRCRSRAQKRKTKKNIHEPNETSISFVRFAGILRASVQYWFRLHSAIEQHALINIYFVKLESMHSIAFQSLKSSKYIVAWACNKSLFAHNGIHLSFNLVNAVRGNWKSCA